MNGPQEKKVYEAPKVTFETDLEVKAGSPCPGLGTGPGPGPCGSDSIDLFDFDN